MIERWNMPLAIACCGIAAAILGPILGCEQAGNVGQEGTTIPVSLPPIQRQIAVDAETIVLGDPQLLAGIPGSGPLSDSEVSRWLQDPRNVAVLHPQLPWHLQSADAVEIPSFTRADVEFGRQLFFDRRISSKVKNFSCADCHPPRDHYAHPGHNRDPAIRHGRAVPPVFNRVLGKSQFWDGRAATLEDQVLQPIFNHDEMGLTSQELTQKLESIPAYRLQAMRLEGEVSERAATRALSAFLRALVTGPCPLDEARRKTKLSWEEWVAQIRAGEAEAGRALPNISDEGRRGARLFFGRARCAECHRGPSFSDESFHTLGLDAAAADPDPGREKVTRASADRGAFKTPSLREVEKTRPYMHRGQLSTLEEVVAFYDRGGGETSAKDPLLKPLQLSAAEQADLVAFLKLLTGGLPKIESGRLPK